MKLDTLLKKVQSHESVRSPPPPTAPLEHLLRRKRRRPADKFAHVRCKVDTAEPRYRPAPPLAVRSTAAALQLQKDNILLLKLIRDTHYSRGRVDCSWRALPAGNHQYHAARVNFGEQTYTENRRLYKMFTTAQPRLTPTVELDRWWTRTVRDRQRRGVPWLLSPPALRRDPAFDAPVGVIRPRVKLSLRIRNGAALGDLVLELFSEACPLTSAMFTALLPFYVGTFFHRKVPGLYWSGGGGACNTCAFPPENFHFPHSEPGLLTMRVSPDDEVNGIFSVTFKALHQFDLRNVVFGRVVLPSRTFDAIRTLGTPLGSQPVVEIAAASLIPSRKPNNKNQLE